MAIASASAASGDFGSALGSRIFSIIRIWFLSACPAPTTVFFTWLGAYSATEIPNIAGASIATPRAWPSFKVATPSLLTFVNKDGVATLKLGQARGVAMLAPAMFGISVAEYAPNQVKKTVVGAGHADKNQILMMLKILLPKAEPKSPDAADALAIAITHAHHRASAALRLKVVGL